MPTLDLTDLLSACREIRPSSPNIVSSLDESESLLLRLSGDGLYKAIAYLLIIMETMVSVSGRNLACHGVFLGRIAGLAIRLESPPDGEMRQSEDAIRDQTAVALSRHPLNRLRSHTVNIVDCTRGLCCPKKADAFCVFGAESRRKAHYVPVSDRVGHADVEDARVGLDRKYLTAKTRRR